MPKWLDLGSCMKAICGNHRGGRIAPFFFFGGFAAGHYPPEELVSLGNHGETIFFLKQQN